ncbi:MAG: protein translocase subunit SecF [Candidatus Pacebacteria bacterium]|nr:protein translocase subunit SecF [Candidatus Paceibacterota bacterium]
MNLMKYKWFYLLFSLVLIGVGLVSLIRWGLKPDIDFTGGSLLELRFMQSVNSSGQEQFADGQDLAGESQPPDQQGFTNPDGSSESFSPTNKLDRSLVRQAVGQVYDLDSIQSAGQDQLILRGQPISNEQKEQALSALREFYPEVQEVSFETVGPTLGRELIIKTVIAVAIVAAIIILYVWKQFKLLKFGISAVLAMFHDSLILIGSFSLLGHFFGMEVDVLFVTALLTTLSFSIHDTIVIYDRIRELLKKYPKLEFAQTANLAVFETLARSINNSVTIIVTLTALVLLGGETIRSFAVALLIGAVAGTYSSTFVAVPLLIVWDELAEKISNLRS